VKINPSRLSLKIAKDVNKVLILLNIKRTAKLVLKLKHHLI